MSQTPHSTELSALAAALRTRPAVWLAPTLLFTAAALAYAALWRQPEWEARQSLLLREEAASGVVGEGRPGRFDGLDSMKIAQETVLELARSRAVVAAALREVGPRRTPRAGAAWPTQRDVEKLQDAIQVKAPQGAEFGKTEVFYLLARDRDPQRAVALVQALTAQLEARLQAVRDRKAASLVTELTQAVELARADLDLATDRLAALERSVGDDLAELRLLTESVGGESNLRMALTAVRNDVRQVRVAQTNLRELLQRLRQAERDPVQLLAAPTDLLASQPSLQRLKDGLMEAQLATARLQGRMTGAHPQVQSAALAEDEIRSHWRQELATAVRGVEAELTLSEARLATLEEQREEIIQRMEHLASVRAHYANAVSQVRYYDEILKQAQQDLAAARAGRAAAHTASLLTRLEEPYTPHDPCGPSRAVIVLAGLLGGLATGVGLVLLQTPVPAAGNDAPRAGDDPAAPAPVRPERLQRAGLRPIFEAGVSAFRGTAARTR